MTRRKSFHPGGRSLLNKSKTWEVSQQTKPAFENNEVKLTKFSIDLSCFMYSIMALWGVMEVLPTSSFFLILSYFFIICNRQKYFSCHLIKKNNS